MVSSKPNWAARLIPLTPAFLLIDPMLGEPLPDVWLSEQDDSEAMRQKREAVWQRPVHGVALHPSIGLHERQHPYLIALEGPDDPLLAMSWEIAQDERNQSQADGLMGTGQAIHRIGAWMQSTLPIRDLAATLATLMRVNTAAITEARYLRLADRRVLDWLRFCVGDSGLGRAIGRISRWLYLDAMGQVTTIDSLTEDGEPLRLNQPEWRQFTEGPVLHQTIARWLGERAFSGLATSLPMGELYARAAEAHTQAKAASARWPTRFKGTRDLSAFATLALLHPGPIDLPVSAEPTDTLNSLAPVIHAERQHAKLS